jgi:glucose/arabinose dehydrogenase
MRSVPTREAIFFVVTWCCAVALARAGTPPAGFTDTAVVTGLGAPTAIAFLPDGRLLTTEQGGRLGILNGGTTTDTLATIPVCSDSEMGLLGIAVDPGFATNGFVYLYRTKPAADGCGSSTGRFNQVVRVTVSGGSAGALTELLSGIRTDGGNHDGGGLLVGPDGKLWVGVGDTGLGDNQGGPGSSTNPYAQDLGELEGKLLRLELDGSPAAGNPFVGQAGARAEIFAYGFRNPFRFGFDPITNAPWLGDVGDLTFEELDDVTAGGNYAWPRCEGTKPDGCEQPGDIDPILTYSHGGSDSLGETIIGGSFAPAGFGGFGGDYFFADYSASNLYHAVPNGARTGLAAAPTTFVTGAAGPVDVIFGPDGALYYVAINDGEVRRVAPAVTGGGQPLPGARLDLRDDAVRPTRRRLSFTEAGSVDLGGGNGSTDDPVVHGGSLRVTGATFDVTYPLPTTGWAYVGAAGRNGGYVYRDSRRVAGPISTLAVRPGRTVSASGAGAALGFSLASDPEPVNVVVTIGGRTYCASFGGTTSFSPANRFKAKGAPAPATCP